MFCFISPGAQGTPGSPGHPGVPGAAGNISDSNCSITFTLNKVMLGRCRLSSRLQRLWFVAHRAKPGQLLGTDS